MLLLKLRRKTNLQIKSLKVKERMVSKNKTRDYNWVLLNKVKGYEKWLFNAKAPCFACK